MVVRMRDILSSVSSAMLFEIGLGEFVVVEFWLFDSSVSLVSIREELFDWTDSIVVVSSESRDKSEEFVVVEFREFWLEICWAIIGCEMKVFDAVFGVSNEIFLIGKNLWYE
jgi:hypothetical protein